MSAQLYGVPLETLLYGDAELIPLLWHGLPTVPHHDAELTIPRRREERLRRRFGLPGPPGKRKADAA